MLGHLSFDLARASIDHVVLGISDLDAGIDQLESLTGIRPAFGGAHPTLGTHNALLSLGSGMYLEVLAPRPGAALAEGFGFLSALDSLIPVTWVVAVDNAREAARQLIGSGFPTTPLVAGARDQPGGGRLEWRMFQLADLGIQGPPFFIEWDGESAHPAVTSPEGCALASLELAHPEAKRLSRLMRILDLDVGVVGSAKSRLRLRIRSGSGVRSLPSG